MDFVSLSTLYALFLFSKSVTIKITPYVQQIVSKRKAEEAGTFKDSHRNTKLHHSFPICPKK